MKLTTYQTNAGTWRMLIDGNVHPKLVGFKSEEAAINATWLLASRRELGDITHDGFEFENQAMRDKEAEVAR